MGQAIANPNFITPTDLKVYGTATTYLTFIMNIITYIYKVYKEADISQLAVIIIAITLSILYVLSFFRKDTSGSFIQNLWVSIINILMIFSSISGVNVILKSAESLSSANSSSVLKNSDTSHKTIPIKPNPIIELGVGDFLKHIIFPTQSWFNNNENINSETNSQVNEKVQVQKQIIQTLSSSKKSDSLLIKSLSENIDTINNKYIRSINIINQTHSAIAQFAAENNIPIEKITNQYPILKPSFNLSDSSNLIINQQQDKQQIQEEQLLQWQKIQKNIQQDDHLKNSTNTKEDNIYQTIYDDENWAAVNYFNQITESIIVNIDEYDSDDSTVTMRVNNNDNDQSQTIKIKSDNSPTILSSGDYRITINLISYAKRPGLHFYPVATYHIKVEQKKS